MAATKRALEWMIGCVHRPKKSKAMTIEEQLARVRNGFRVTHCSATVDQCETIIKENASTLNYVTPHFRAEAEVEVPRLRDGDIYTIGWVQAVTEMKFYNHYPTGVSSWEIQELNSGDSEAVSDADGRQYPWYGITTERVTLKGAQQSEQIVRVYMNDNFSPTVSWAIPVGRDQPDTLQRVYRDQSICGMADSQERNQWRDHSSRGLQLACGCQHSRRLLRGHWTASYPTSTIHPRNHL